MHHVGILYGKLRICNDGNHRSMNVKIGQATSEPSLSLPYEQEQKVMGSQAYYSNVLCRQHEKGCSGCWTWGVFLFSCDALAQSGPWLLH